MKAFVLILFFMTVSCSNDDEPKPICFQDENMYLAERIKNVTGTIRTQQCGGEVILIQLDEKIKSYPLGLFQPCNLDTEFQIDGTRVVFSGYIHMYNFPVDICADFFEITDIRLADQ
jgi:hypothetical protein